MRRSLFLLFVSFLFFSLGEDSQRRLKEREERERESREGGGIFGEWILDQFHLNGFNYTINELNNSCALWSSSLSLLPKHERRHDHWRMFGNFRVNVLAVDDGYVQVFTNDRGGTWLNEYHKNSKNIGGAFSYVSWPRQQQEEQKEVICSSFHFGPQNSSQYQYHRIFGSFYFKHGIEDKEKGLLIDHTIHAPHGNHPAVVDEVLLLNNGDSILSFDHFEFFDINYIQLLQQWIRTGPAGVIGNSLRRELLSSFIQTATYDSNCSCLISKMKWVENSTSPPPPPPGSPSPINYQPFDVFLALLDGPPFTEFYTDQSKFFGNDVNCFESPAQTQSDFPSTSLEPHIAFSQPAAFVLKHGNITLFPNSSITLRFGFGYVPTGMTINEVIGGLVGDVGSVEHSSHLWKNDQVQFSVLQEEETGSEEEEGMREEERREVSEEIKKEENRERERTEENKKEKKKWDGEKFLRESSIISRELQWRSLQLLSTVVYQEYYNRFYFPQGSAYLYLSGVDGAPRDQCLFVVAATPLNPSLARDTLSLVLNMRDQQSLDVWYSFSGYGETSSAKDLHRFPSDLDIFIMFALSEYLSFTADFSFLNETIGLWPNVLGGEEIETRGREKEETRKGKEREKRGTVVKEATVLEHIRLGFEHLRDKIGVGSHSLLRLLEGDWDDSVVASNPSPSAFYFTTKSGESIPNTQMAYYVLPKLAKQLAPYAPSLSSSMLEFAATLHAPLVNSLSNGKWFPRAWMFDSLNRTYLRGNADNWNFTNSSCSEIDSTQSFLSLQSQPWGILASVENPFPSLPPLLSSSEIETVLNNIKEILSSPIGPIQRPSLRQVWPAISQLHTWAVASTGRQQEAWDLLMQHTYSTHSSVFPNEWVGVLSGPDGFVSSSSNGCPLFNEGGTWCTPVTPQIDFPISNNNPDAMFLFAFLRLVGIRPSSSSQGGLTFDFTSPLYSRSLSINLPLFSFLFSQKEIQISYHFIPPHESVDELAVPIEVILPNIKQQNQTTKCSINFKPITCEPSSLHKSLHKNKEELFDERSKQSAVSLSFLAQVSRKHQKWILQLFL